MHQSTLHVEDWMNLVIDVQHVNIQQLCDTVMSIRMEISDECYLYRVKYIIHK